MDAPRKRIGESSTSLDKAATGTIHRRPLPRPGPPRRRRSEPVEGLDRHIQWLAFDPPTYLARVLGPVPRDENLREVRKRGATVIETLRIDNGIAHEDHAFGPTLRYNSDLVIPPAVPRQVILQIETIQRTLYPDPPDPGPDLGLGL